MTSKNWLRSVHRGLGFGLGVGLLAIGMVFGPAAGALADPVADDQTKVIGSLRIGIPLYNVYLNEADEWSRRLVTEVSEWALELNRPMPDSTVGLAHALAGSSATVGFHALSDIARSLEGALHQAQRAVVGIVGIEGRTGHKGHLLLDRALCKFSSISARGGVQGGDGGFV